MRFDIVTKPAALEFGSGTEGFGLYPKRVSGAGRMALINALGRGNCEEIQVAVEDLIEGWKGVFDKDGKPIPFKREQGGSNLGEVIGQLPMGQQVDIIVAVIEFVGVPKRILDQVERSFAELGGSVDPRPTDSPADAGGASASTASSPSAT